MHRSPGFHAAIALLAPWLAGCDGATEPPTAAVRLVAATAFASAGTVGTELVPAPIVRALDADGRRVAGVAVTFEVGVGAGSIAQSAVETDADGLAGVGRWTLGTRAGAQTLTARSPGFADVVFTAAAAPGPVAMVVARSGNGMIVPAGAALGAPLRARVTDAYDNGIAGVPVTFTVTSGGGSIAPGPVLTDAAGEAVSEVWTLGPAAGEQQVLAACETASATFSAFAITPTSGLSGRLAFVSEADGNADIYAVNADGTELARLTADPAEDLQPAWEPGSRISFVRRTARESRIFSMAPDGSDVQGPMVDPTFVEDPAVSPDGLVLAYSSNADVRSINRRTGVISVLAEGTGYDAQPAWSPDGRQLAFVSDRVAYDFLLDIYTMNADGTGQVRLTNDTPGGSWNYYLHPTWSPDGTRIAYVVGSSTSPLTRVMRWTVAVMDRNGSAERALASAGYIGNAPLFSPGSVAWSPDGRGIAFSFAECDGSTATGCTTRSVKYVSLDGGAAITLIPSGHSPAWR